VISDHSSDGGSRVVGRELPIPDISKKPVPVPALHKRFGSWAEFFSYLAEYARSTNQIIRKSVALSVTARNEAIAKTKAGQAGMFVRFVPLEWDTYKRIFICTHGWRQHSRGTGKRPQKFLRSIECPLKFSVVVRYFQDEQKRRLEVESAHLFHNHVIEHEVFKTYAENRGIVRTVQAKVDGMIQNERKRKAIYDALLEQGENVIMKDVENMIYAHRAAVKREDDDTECFAKLTEFVSADESNTIDAVIHAMVYATSKDEYDANHTTLKEVCSAFGFEVFFDYFEKNWATCTDMWVMYKRMRLPHLRVHTNNHLKSFFCVTGPGRYKHLCLRKLGPGAPSRYRSTSAALGQRRTDCIH
jgi:hypothetical protein